MIMRIKSILSGLSLALLMAGCIVVPPRGYEGGYQSDVQDWGIPSSQGLGNSNVAGSSLNQDLLGSNSWRHRQQLEVFDHWQVKAKVGSNQGASGGRATWQQRDERFDVRISGPLGIGAVEMRGTANQVEVENRKETIVSNDPEMTMRELLGWSLPTRNAQHWLIGMPGPEKAARAWYGPNGLLVKLEQGDWLIEYPEYQRHGQMQLPRKILLTNGGLKLQLVLAGWSAV